MRFDGFNKVWESKQIGEIAEVVGGGTPKTEIVDYWDGEIKWFTPSEIGKTKYVFDSDRHITEKGLKNSSAKLLPKDALLLSSRATVGEISIALTECSTNQGFQSLITKSNVDNDFIYYLISTIKNEFLRRSSGSTFLEINKNEIKRMPINIPELSEQKKISNLFSAIDNKIEMLEKKCEYYQDFKKYLMQRIFSSSDDKLRFADCTGEWNLFKLGDIVELMRNGCSENQVSFETEFPVTRIETISKGILNFDKVGYVEKIDSSYLLQYGDILLSNINSLKYIGNCVFFDEDKPLYHGMNLMLMRFKDDFNKKYLFYYMKFYQQWFQKMACQAVNQASINQSSLKKFPFYIPPTIDEQNKIVNVIDDTEHKINSIEDQIIKMEEFKKGLLQQMFV